MKFLLLLLFWSLWYVNFSSRTVISPLLPLIEDELAISHALAGSIFSFLSIGYSITLALTGLLSSRIGYKRSIALGFAILTAALFCLRYTTTFSSLATVAVFIGLGTGLYLPNAIPLLTTIIRGENWGKTFSFHETAASFSVLSIPLFTALALPFFYWRTLFFFLSAACVIVGIFFWTFSPDPRPQEEKRVRFSQVLRRRDFWIIAILLITAASSSLGLYNIMPLFLVKEKGIELEMANTVFGFSRIGGFFVTLMAGFLVDWYGVKRILLFSLLATGLSTIGVAVSQTFPLLVTMLIAQATFSPGFFPAVLVAISRLTTLHERGIFTGATMATGAVVGLGFTPAILGAVADAWSFQIGILVLGVLTTLSCILLRGIRKV
jgi:MFS family permease